MVCSRQLALAWQSLVNIEVVRRTLSVKLKVCLHFLTAYLAKIFSVLAESLEAAMLDMFRGTFISSSSRNISVEES